ncbi:alpha/beta fold hydrolase [uncultured Pseudacidovorax sp.]|uniref:alpha/beta fold hydrolase n=1 Tax=uncultured Pseudacidovorax sp. TaxID=679313 RepID=UPI0025DDED61|nr:alpha/beta fold hydrolase [uncultured Pseudacidovorax sp.]
MPFVTSHGRAIYYERQGDGPVVLFCHGAGSNAATWWQQLPAFAGRYSCLTMDIRCFGRSAAPLAEFDLQLFVDDVVAILDQEGIDRVRLVGQSLGGMIGLKLALTHPGRVAAFAACDTSLAVDHPVLLDILATRQLSHKAVSIEQRSLGRWFLANEPEKAALYAQINHFNPSAHSIPAADWGAALQGLMAPGRRIPLTALDTLACPTLFVVGDQDPIVPVAVAREFHQRVSGSELVVVADAGHSAYFEQPRAFNAAVLDFLDRRAA